MKNIIYIKGSDINDVRLHKFLVFLRRQNVMLNFWGWSRTGESPVMDGVSSIYLQKSGGYGKKSQLFFYYILWVVRVFLKCLSSNLENKIIIAIDFDSALPVYLASRFKKINYIYEVYDDFALRYRFPSFIKNLIHSVDCKIMNKSECVIHVDENRVHYKNCKWIIIENTPNDIYNGKERDYSQIQNKFAVIGLLSKERGLESIYKFAINNPDIKFLVVGRFIDTLDDERFRKLPNVEVHSLMPQEELYKMMYECASIFSLYDPSVEINRLAASNKVYDAMMHGIPVITNKEVVNSRFIKNNNIGFVINYNYDNTWACLSEKSFIEKAKIMGANGRNIYLNNYLFDMLASKRLLPILNDL